MYQVHDDRVIKIKTVPWPDVGAPLPAVVGDEHRLLLAYIASSPDPEWDGTYVEVVSPDSPEEPIAIVAFERPYCHLFGPPNDEAFAGHPLAARGLAPYSVSEIAESSWVHALERMNAVHQCHRPESFSDYHHYIFAFHDSTFECVARGFTFEMHHGSMRSAVQLMAKALGQDAV